MINRRNVSFGILAGAAAGAMGAGAAAAAPVSEATATALRAAIGQSMTEKDVVGLAVALTGKDGVLWAEGFGFTDGSRQTRVTPETLFSVQSISKTYTTTAFLALAGAKAFRLDERLREAVPDFTMRSRAGPLQQELITYRHLLSHRAGLPHEAPKGGNFDDCGCSLEEHARSVFGTWMKAEVGDRYAYSNVGIDLVGYAMQRRLGAPFEAVMRRVLLAPLGMASSTFDLQEALASGALARGQLEGKDIPPRPLPIKPSGGMYSNVLDMSRFVRLHLNGGRAGSRRIAPEASLALMGDIAEPVEGQVNGYGLGLERRRRWGRTILTHGGGGFGFQTEQRWIPSEGVGVVVLTNYGGDDSVAVPVAERVLELYLRGRGAELADDPDPVLTAAPAEDPPAEVLRRLEGSYRGYSNVRGLVVREGRLWLKAGDALTALRAHGPAEFTTATERFRFRLNNFGRPLRVDYLGPNGVDTYFPNGLAGDPAGPSKPEWARFVGDYEGVAFGVSPFTSTISIQNGYLFSSRGGGTLLDEYQPGLFFTSEGEAVTFDGPRMRLGNRPFTRKTPA